MKVLSFDIEDWWVYKHASIGEEKDWRPRLDAYLGKILDLLDEHGIKATFFVLGEVATHNPDVVKRICERGHHIGCHSYSHQFLGKSTPEEVAADIANKLSVMNLKSEMATVSGEFTNSYKGNVVAYEKTVGEGDSAFDALVVGVSITQTVAAKN